MDHETVAGTVPMTVLDKSAVAEFELFNPNDWEGRSRGVVQSCSTEYSVLRYGLGRIARVCSAPREHCRTHIATLQDHWKRAQWDVTKGVCFAQVPELHVLIEAFFAGIKGYLTSRPSS